MEEELQMKLLNCISHSIVLMDVKKTDNEAFRKIAMLMTDMDDQNVGKARYDGYRKALKAHGIQHEDCLVISGDLSMESGYDCMKRLLDDGIVPDAVFAASDYAAFGAMCLLHERKIRIPEDISVIDNH